LAQKYPLPVFKQAVQQAGRMVSYAKQSLQRYQDYLDGNPKVPKQTFFTKLFKAEEDEKVSFLEIMVNAQAFIVAGSDTTARTLTYLLWSVCQRRQLRDALAEEVSSLPEGFTDQDLRELPLLNQCIEETLRLFPAAPSSLPRVVPPCGEELGGYWFPGGTIVAAQAYTMNRHAEIFPNPDEFDPHRWAAPTKAMKATFMTFGRGPRSMSIHACMCTRQDLPTD
jgi:cytochrome P450